MSGTSSDSDEQREYDNSSQGYGWSYTEERVYKDGEEWIERTWGDGRVDRHDTNGDYVERIK